MFKESKRERETEQNIIKEKVERDCTQVGKKRKINS